MRTKEKKSTLYMFAEKSPLVVARGCDTKKRVQTKSKKQCTGFLVPTTTFLVKTIDSMQVSWSPPTNNLIELFPKLLRSQFIPFRQKFCNFLPCLNRFTTAKITFLRVIIFQILEYLTTSGYLWAVLSKKIGGAQFIAHFRIEKGPICPHRPIFKKGMGE